ncbi:MAG: hypothetical protein MSD82_07180 [Prevotella sp.]|nr:hypothetical protein [Prevotella sp.]
MKIPEIFDPIRPFEPDGLPAAHDRTPGKDEPFLRERILTRYANPAINSLSAL